MWIYERRAFQVEGTVRAKALRWACAWCVQKRVRRPHEAGVEGDVGSDEDREIEADREGFVVHSSFQARESHGGI